MVDSAVLPGEAERAEHFERFQRAHPQLRMQRLLGASGARSLRHNLGAAHAGGDLLVFLADDFEPVPHFLEAHADFHELNPDPHAVAVGPGLFDDALRQQPFARWVEDSGQIFGVPFRRCAGAWPRNYFYAGNASIKRSKFESLGGFDERFATDAWDDYEFGLRFAASGGYSQVVTEAIGIHRHAVSYEERCQTMEQAGEAARVLEAAHPEVSRDWPWLKPPSEIVQEWSVDADLLRLDAWQRGLNAAFRQGYERAGADAMPDGLRQPSDR